MVDLAVIETLGVLGTAAVTIALVLLLYRTVKQLEATVTLSRVQTEYRFRPWVGPLNSIKALPHGKIFPALYFEYPVAGGKSGYGMISEYDPKNDSFTHKDMWVQSPNDLPE